MVYEEEGLRKNCYKRGVVLDTRFIYMVMWRERFQKKWSGIISIGNFGHFQWGKPTARELCSPAI